MGLSRLVVSKDNSQSDLMMQINLHKGLDSGRHVALETIGLEL